MSVGSGLMELCKGLISGALGFALIAGAPGASASEYKIGAQDRLRIKVYEWPALTDEVVVSSEGFISLPIAGSIKAAGNSTSELAAAVANALQQRAGLPELPFASVEVSQFRPFYILGEVQRPGEYAYRPGMTAVMALSIAGGRYRPPEMQNLRLTRDVIQSRSSLSAAESKRRELRVRLARLRAELAGKNTVQVDRASAEPDYPAELIDQERSILQARQSAYQNQLTGMRRQIEIGADEIKSLKARLESSVKQQISVDREIAGLKGLSDKGLLLAPRQTTLERLSAQIEGDQKDIDARIAQVRQNIAQSEALMAKLADDRQRDLGVEIRMASAQLEEADQQVAMHKNLIAEAESLSGRIGVVLRGSRSARLGYRVTRTEPGGPREFSAQADDLIEPGDVITVDQSTVEGPFDSESASSASAGDLPSTTQ